MPAAVDQDRTACEGQAPSRMRLVTTFYDLIAALHESIEPGEEDLVTTAVVHLVNAGHVKFLERPLRGVESKWSVPRINCRVTQPISPPSLVLFGLLPLGFVSHAWLRGVVGTPPVAPDQTSS